MNKKLGPLKLWQWAAIGGASGLILYFYLKNKTPEEAKPILSGAFGNPGEIGGGGGGSTPVEAPKPVAGEPGPTGVPGPPGAPAEPPAPPQFSQQQVEALDKLAESANNPVTNTAKAASKPIKQGPRFPNINPKTGEHYRIEKAKGGVWHIYHNGHRVFVKNKVGSAVKKGNHAAKHVAHKESRQKPHAGKAEHTKKHAGGTGAVSHRQHGRPTPLQHRIKASHPVIHHPAAKPVTHAVAKAKTHAPPKHKKRRRR